MTRPLYKDISLLCICCQGPRLYTKCVPKKIDAIKLQLTESVHISDKDVVKEEIDVKSERKKQSKSLCQRRWGRSLRSHFRCSGETEIKGLSKVLHQRDEGRGGDEWETFLGSNLPDLQQLISGLDLWLFRSPWSTFKDKASPLLSSSRRNLVCTWR